MESQYNLRSPAVKRLMKEAQELSEATEQFYAQPLEDNLFEWHFTIRGPADSEFDGGIYHGRIVLPPEYPMKPPSIILLTPNGRFETHKKICLSISGYHPESWQPSWSLRTALLAIIGFMPTHGNGAIGSLDYTSDERKILAKRSVDWKCEQCGLIRTFLRPVTEASELLNKEAKELGAQINLQGEKEKSSTSNDANHISSEPPSAPVAVTSTSPFPPSVQAYPPTVGAVPQTFPYPQFPAFMLPTGHMPPFIPPNAVPPLWPNPPFPMHHPGFPWPPFPPCQPFGVGNAPGGLLSYPNTPVQVTSSTVEASSSESTTSPSAAAAPNTTPTVVPLPSTSTATSSSPSSFPTATSSVSANTSPSGADQRQSPAAVSSVSTSASPVAVSSSNDVRHRHVVGSESVTNVDVTSRQHSPQSQVTPQNNRRSASNSWLVNILVMILVICIVILIARRAYLTYSRH